MAKIVMNELRTNIVETLKNSNEPMTLGEIASALDLDKISSGTTNSLVNAGVLKVSGKKKVAKVTYVEVNTYEIGDLSVIEVADGE